MPSRGGINELNDKQSKSAKTPVSTKVVRESLKSIILSGESELDKFVSHRILYILGFLTGWNTRVFSLELIPIVYFFVWAIVLFGLREVQFGLLFLASNFVIVFYFLLLHTVISSWSKIKHWFIKKAKKRNGIANMTLEDIKYLLIYTRKIFGVKATIPAKVETEFDSNILRKYLKTNKKWQFALNITVIVELMIITAGGIYGFIQKIEILEWFVIWWYLIFVFIIPIVILIVGLVVSKVKINSYINIISDENFDEVLRVLNDFEVFGGKSAKIP
ncbi:MAG: hypothetical protein HZR80_12965 [Candidatus Heimdallarchaeota archaeon]